MIIVTGAAGFIGSSLVAKLNNRGAKDVVLVDDFSNGQKNLNIIEKAYRERVERNLFFEWLEKNHDSAEFIFHLGARTDTTEFNRSVFDELNLNYSKKMWETCCKFKIPLVYASSAATYGLGEMGYSDDHDLVEKLKPLNPYGDSKNDFDKWVLGQKETPPFWAGLKFFNVYGPNEYHKGRMASVVFHAFQQIEQTDSMKLFRSHKPDFLDGEQKRDFIYVKDVVKICIFFFLNRKINGIFNVGTGDARTFVDLASNVFRSMRKEINIGFIDTPEDIRDKYQYFTEARIEKLRAAGYDLPFASLEEGIEEYVQNYLIAGNYY